MRYPLALMFIFSCDYAPTEHTHPEPDGACTTRVEGPSFPNMESETTPYGLLCKDGLTRNICVTTMGDWEFQLYYTCEEYCHKYESDYYYGCIETIEIIAAPPEDEEETWPWP